MRGAGDLQRILLAKQYLGSDHPKGISQSLKINAIYQTFEKKKKKNMSLMVALIMMIVF